VLGFRIAQISLICASAEVFRATELKEIPQKVIRLGDQTIKLSPLMALFEKQPVCPQRRIELNYIAPVLIRRRNFFLAHSRTVFLIQFEAL